jgi:O-antigen/teichoic acid export membrane protein
MQPERMSIRPGSVRQNVVYSLLEFGSLPVLMLATAPALLRALGQQQYGTWMLVNSIAATAGGLGGGFGDAATRFVALYRGRGDGYGVNRSLLAVLLVNCVLGSVAAAAVIIGAPLLLNRVFDVGPALRAEALVSIRIAGLILAIRFPAAVFMSATRAHELYRPVVLVAVLSRAALMTSAVALARSGFGLYAILLTTFVVEALNLVAQAAITLHLVPVKLPTLSHLAHGVREVLGFGTFTWLKSVLGVLFGHADRLLVGALLGVAPLAIFVLCSQVAQLIPAVIAAGFNFLFPNLASTVASKGTDSAEHSYRRALAISSCLVAAMFLVGMVAGRRLLHIWLGNSSVEHSPGLLTTLLVGNTLLALSVVPQYTALALGRSRSLAALNFVIGVTSIVLAYLLLRHFGLPGIGVAKVVAGGISLWTFAIVARAFRPPGIFHAAPQESFSQS